MAQELSSAVAKIYMVAELLARSPNILGTLPSPPPAMAAPGMTPGEAFLKPPIADEEFMDMTVGDLMSRLGFVGAAGIVGAVA